MLAPFQDFSQQTPTSTLYLNANHTFQKYILGSAQTGMWLDRQLSNQFKYSSQNDTLRLLLLQK